MIFDIEKNHKNDPNKVKEYSFRAIWDRFYNISKNNFRPAVPFKRRRSAIPAGAFKEEFSSLGDAAHSNNWPTKPKFNRCWFEASREKEFCSFDFFRLLYLKQLNWRTECSPLGT